jgi:hypothetical protein
VERRRALAIVSLAAVLNGVVVAAQVFWAAADLLRRARMVARRARLR